MAVIDAIVSLFRRISPSSARDLALWVGRLVWWLGIRRAVALDNIAQAFPQWSRPQQRAIAKAAYESMARAMMDSLRADLLSDDELQQAVVIDDWKGLDVLLAQNQPVLIASAHLGSWELLGEVMARRGYVISAIVRPLSGAFNAWLMRSRAKAGIELIMQRGAMQRILDALKRGRAVVQLLDQSLSSRHAVWVPFFGRPASTSPALSLAAWKTGAPVYVVLSVRRNEQLHMVVEGPVEVPKIGTRADWVRAHVTELSQILEKYVRQCPEQWLWLHRRWKKAQAAPTKAQAKTAAV